MEKTQADYLEFHGRISLTAANRNPYQLRFLIELQGKETGSLQLSDSFGLGVITAQWNQTSASITRSGKTQEYENFTAMTQALLHTPLPAQSLRYWLQGIPISASTPRNQSGFQELGWNIQIIAEQAHVRVLELTQAMNAEQRLRLVLELP